MQNSYTFIPKPEDVEAAQKVMQALDAADARKDKFLDSLAETFAEAHVLLIKKHRDYGPKNIALSPGGPLNGLRVRMHDKLARINHLVDNDAEPANESLRDSFLDLMNYSAIALMVIDGNWEGADLEA